MAAKCLEARGLAAGEIEATDEAVRCEAVRDIEGSGEAANGLVAGGRSGVVESDRSATARSVAERGITARGRAVRSMAVRGISARGVAVKNITAICLTHCH